MKWYILKLIRFGNFCTLSTELSLDFFKCLWFKIEIYERIKYCFAKSTFTFLNIFYMNIAQRFALALRHIESESLVCTRGCLGESRADQAGSCAAQKCRRARIGENDTGVELYAEPACKLYFSLFLLINLINKTSRKHKSMITLVHRSDRNDDRIQNLKIQNISALHFWENPLLVFLACK